MNPTRFQRITTQDGSPTLAPLSSDGTRLEPMHSLAGALGETRAVYGDAIDWALEHAGEPACVLVVGLGVGYVEMLAIARSMRKGIELAGMISFESQALLRDGFQHWLDSDAAIKPADQLVTPDAIAGVVHEVCNAIAQAEGVSAQALHQACRECYASGQALIADALTSESQLPAPAHAICYDAYSSNSSPQLWEQTFLQDFLARAAAKRACLTTYAAKGTLKRALLASGFALEKRSGFAGKRERSFAWR